MLIVGLQVSSTNVGPGCGCHPTGPFILPPAPVPCHSVWPRPVACLAVLNPARFPRPRAKFRVVRVLSEVSEVIDLASDAVMYEPRSTGTLLSRAQGVCGLLDGTADWKSYPRAKRVGSAMLLRTLVVDDEQVARRVLREELELIAGVEIIGEAESGGAALDEIARLHPDLVLLDLQMPSMSGLDVVGRLKCGEHMPIILIVTAYDQYALRAFDAGAIDYLLEPVRQERLAEAIERVRRLIAAIERMAHPQKVTRPSGGQRIRSLPCQNDGS
jgi:CheY-like chemotaxis protein